MINLTDLRAGHFFREGDELYRVIDYKHQKIGRGSANIIIKARNLKSGSIVRKTYISGAKVEEVKFELVRAQFLYSQDNQFFFMDAENFEQFEVPEELLEDKAKFLKEGVEVNVRIFEDQVVDVDLPLKVSYRVKEAPPDIRGNTAQGVTKEVFLENNLKVKVPMFIKKDDMIVVDTRKGEYVERGI